MAYVPDSVRREANQSSAMDGKFRLSGHAAKRDDSTRVASVPRGTFKRTFQASVNVHDSLLQVGCVRLHSCA